MLNNEKGSILSVALIVVAILSFSITSVTAYTSNVHNRSNELIQERSDTVAARSILNQALYELKDFVIHDLAPSNFNDLTVEQEDDLAAFIEMLENTYTFNNFFDPDDENRYGIRIVDRTPYNEEGYDGITAVFRVLFDRFDGTTIYRDTYISLEEARVPDTPSEVYENIIERILADKDNLTEICKDEDGNPIENCDSADEFESETGAGQGANRLFNLTTNVYLPNDLELEGQKNHGRLDLNGFTMIVDGNLHFDDLESIHGDGVLIVRNVPDDDTRNGNFTLEAFHRIDVYGDVLIIVEGETVLSLNHPRRSKILEVQDDGVFTLMTMKNNPSDNNKLDTTNISGFGDTYWISDPHPDEFIYLGTEPFSFFNQDPEMPSWAEIFLYYGEEFPPGVSFKDSSFNIE